MNHLDAGPAYTGRCLCGAVEFRVGGPVSPPIACHCTDCARHSGGVWAFVGAATSDVAIERDRLAWVRVSPDAMRGFCRDCGGFLFRRRTDGGRIDVSLGALDRPHDLALTAHVHVGESLWPVADDGLPHHHGALPTRAGEPDDEPG